MVVRNNPSIVFYVFFYEVELELFLICNRKVLVFNSVLRAVEMHKMHGNIF